MKQFLFSLILLPFLIGAQTAAGTSSLLNQAHPKVFFTENLGQVIDQHGKQRPDVLFGGVIGNMAFHLRKTGISYQLGKPIVNKDKKDTVKKSLCYRLDLDWVNCNRDCEVEKEGMHKDYNNFYDEPYPKGITHVRSCDKVTYKQLYPNVDLKFYGKENILKYDLIVKPNSDPSKIQLKVKGASNILLQEDGSVLIKTSLGDVHEGTPVAYQDGKKIPVQWSVKNNTLGFKLGAYDHKKVLVIDPAVRLWGTFYGTSAHEQGFNVATDTVGNVYMTGYIFGAMSTGTIIATVGSFQSTMTPSTSDFLVKFDPNGVRLWGTFYGGYESCSIGSCCVDNLCNVYICGGTGYTVTSPYISTPGAHQTVPGGNYDAYLAKFDPNGVRIWGTFYGGSGSEGASDCKTDKYGNVYMVGTTSSSLAASSTLIATPGAYQTAYAGGSNDAFIVKFNSSGVRQWGTFYGGTVYESPYSCSVDTAGNIFMQGMTESFTGISTPGAHQVNYISPYPNPYIVKFSKNGNRKWGTYYCGTSTDWAYCCAADQSGNVYMVGSAGAYTNNAIATASAYQSVCIGNYDAYLVKFDTAGVRMWGTYIGGTGNVGEELHGCAIDPLGNIFVSGSTTSSNYISTPGVHQYNYAGSQDAFLMKFDPSGNRQWGTYYGGPQYNSTFLECSYSCATDKNGNVFITGNTDHTLSDGVFNSPGCHQPIPGANSNPDAFLAKFNNCPTAPTPVTASASVNWICPNQTVILSANSPFSNFLWNNSASTNTISVSPSVTTEYFFTTASPTPGCIYGAAVTVSVTNYTVTTNTVSTCPGNTLVLTANGAQSYTWSTSATTSSIIVSPSVTTVYTVSGNNFGGCALVKTFTTTVIPNPTVTVTSLTVCGPGIYTLSASGANTYSWNNNSSLSTSTINVSSFPIVLTVTGTTNGCKNIKTGTVTPLPLPNLSVTASSMSVCVGASVSLVASGANSYSWSNAATTNSIVDVPTYTATFPYTYTYSVIGTSTNGCSTSTIITIMATPIPTIIVNSGTICSGQSFTLNPSGGQAYSFFSPVVSPSATTVYSINGIVNGCPSTSPGTGTVTVLPNPTVSCSASNNTVCSGKSVTLTASGALSYTWNNSTTGSVLIMTPLTNTIYFVVGSDVNTCTGSANYSIAVDVVNLNAITSHTMTLCNGETATLTASGANTYTWSNAMQGNHITISPSVTTTYTVYGTSSFGCDTSFVITQTVVECAGIRTIDLFSSFSIYPNPSHNEFYFETSLDLKANLILYDVIGRKALEAKVIKGKNKITTSSLPPGLYHSAIILNGKLIPLSKLVIQ